MEGLHVCLMDATGAELGRLHVPCEASAQQSLVAEVRRANDRAAMLEVELREERAAHASTAKFMRAAQEAVIYCLLIEWIRDLFVAGSTVGLAAVREQIVAPAPVAPSAPKRKTGGFPPPDVEVLLKRIVSALDLVVGQPKAAGIGQLLGAAGRTGDKWERLQRDLDRMVDAGAISYTHQIVPNAKHNVRREVTVTLLRLPLEPVVAEQVEAPPAWRPLSVDWEQRNAGVFGLVAEDCSAPAAQLFKRLAREALRSPSGDLDATSGAVLGMLSYSAEDHDQVARLLSELKDARHITWTSQRREDALPLWRIEPRGVRS